MLMDGMMAMTQNGINTRTIEISRLILISLDKSTEKVLLKYKTLNKIHC
jgi:hypothetical protein